jgi:aminomethyltransferase
MADLVAAGATPAGLGARDTLRLEAGLALWGQDIDESTTPIEAGLAFAVSFGHDFVGERALESQARKGVGRSLVWFALDERGVPRHGYRLRTRRGGAGVVTSGNMSPMLGRGIGAGYISPAPVDNDLDVEMRHGWQSATIVEPPFHK